MKITLKKVLSIVLSLAMIATSITVYNTTTAKAADANDYASWLKTDKNLAYKQEVTESAHKEGDKVLVTDGVLSWNSYSGINEPNGSGFIEVSLGKAYDASEIGQVVVWWRDPDANFCPKDGFEIQYGYMGEYTVATKVTDYTGIGVQGTGDGRQYMIPVEISGVTGQVDTVRIYMDTIPGYGGQISEIAVFSNNVELTQALEPAGIQLELGDNEGDVKFTITPDENQNGYKYEIYLDDAKVATMTELSAGTEYTLKNVESGTHTIKVVSAPGGTISPSNSITSDPIKVTTIVDRIQDPSINLAYQKDWFLLDAKLEESKKSIEGGDNSTPTDGIVKNGEYVTPAKETAGSYVTIDLGTEYVASGLDEIYVFYAKTDINTGPQSDGYQIRYSTDNIEYTTVATVTKADFDAQKTAQNKAPFGVVAKISEQTIAKSVRYVQIYYPQAILYGAQMTEVSVFDTDGDAEEYVDGAVVAPPVGVTATSGAYNTITATVEGAVGHDDYTYEVTAAGVTKSGIIAGETVVFENVAAGKYVVTAKSIDVAGDKSKLVSSEAVTVEDGFTYVGKLSPATLFGDKEGLVRLTGLDGVTATASSDNANAFKAIDNDVESRWTGETTDPQWITIDLGEKCQVKELAISWEAAASAKYYVKVSSNGGDFEQVAVGGEASGEAARVDSIVLKQPVEARYVQIYSVARTTNYGHSIYEMAVYGSESEKAVYNVTIDDKVNQVVEGDTFELPAGVKYGYFDGTNMYKAGTEVTITSDMTFTSVTDANFTIVMEQKAGLRYLDDDLGAGLRFQTTIDSKVDKLLGSAKVKTGTLITAKDIYDDAVKNPEGELTLDSNYLKLNIENTGWRGTEGVYCGSIVKISDNNYVRGFIARSYVTITYKGGEVVTYYSKDPSFERSVQYIANAIRTDGYKGIDEKYHELIGTYADAN